MVSGFGPAGVLGCEVFGVFLGALGTGCSKSSESCHEGFRAEYEGMILVNALRSRLMAWQPIHDPRLVRRQPRGF